MGAILGNRSALGIDIDPGSAGNLYRNARLQHFLAIVKTVIADTGRCSILDVGGTSQYWKPYLNLLPDDATVVLCNLQDYGEEFPDRRFRWVEGDACDLKFDDDQFDIVHSNSVIEHVGPWSKMAAMASEVRRVAKRHFVQTPNYWFPIEPHVRTPFFHYLPEPWRMELLLRKKRGFWPRAVDVGDATDKYQSAILLTFRQMQFLFPESTIEREWAFGLTKSLIAVKSG